jgi:hypothetical protein
VSTTWAPPIIASVVEGDGEVSALPKLLHRIAAEFGVPDVLTPTPMRIPRGKITTVGGIERGVAAGALRVRGNGGVLVLLDADDDCPAQHGPVLLARARSARPDKLVSVVLANREFEAWFLAAAPSLAGQFGFPADFSRPESPELPRDCKGLLTKARPKGQPYKETIDQAALASVFDLKMAREHSGSFDKFYREVSRLLGIDPQNSGSSARPELGRTKNHPYNSRPGQTAATVLM